MRRAFARPCKRLFVAPLTWLARCLCRLIVCVIALASAGFSSDTGLSGRILLYAFWFFLISTFCIMTLWPIYLSM